MLRTPRCVLQTKRRKLGREFRAELLEALEERLQQAPHRALQEAVNQLKMPRLRHPDHQSRR